MIKKIIILTALSLLSINSSFALSSSGSELNENLSGSLVKETVNYDLKVGTIERKPFAYKQDGQWTGFTIDLWKEIAENNKFEYSFIEYKDFGKMLGDTEAKLNDLSAANISITSEREKVLDYSNPIYDSGLNIMGLVQNSGVITFYDSIYTKLILGLKILLGLLLVITHYFFVKNVADGHIAFYSYFTEIIPIFFEIIVQIKDFMGAKLLGLTTLIIAIFTVAYFSQVITIQLNQGFASGNTNQQLISYKELKETKNGVTNKSTAMSYLESHNIPIEIFSQLPNIYTALENGEIDYVVHDDPVLRYHAKNSEKQIFKVLGKIFNHDKYAILFPQYSDHRNLELIEIINISILEMKENGRYDEIYNKYFN